MFVNGAGIDMDTMEIGQDKVNYLGVDGTISIVAPPNSVPALDESIKSTYKMLSQNYHLPTSFVEVTTDESEFREWDGLDEDWQEFNKKENPKEKKN